MSAVRNRTRRGWSGWLYVSPALAFYTIFVLWPLVQAGRYSFYDWDGITQATPIGLGNYATVLTDGKLLGAVLNSFFLIIFFTLLPTAVALVVAVLIKEMKSRILGTVSQTMLFLPQIIPGAAAAIAWAWMYSSDGLVNQILRAVGAGDLARVWLGDFNAALPSVGVIGSWINLGFCVVLLLAGIGKIDGSIYEAARIDGAGFWSTLRSVTLPGLRAEIGVCVTMTMISALASFDVVFMSTRGGPGFATMVPGVLVYQLGFTEARVGLASALALVLTALILVIILPLQRLFRRDY